MSDADGRSAELMGEDESLVLTGRLEESSFADLMKSIGERAIEAGNTADQMSVAAVEGNANVAEVVTAVANAELALQTVVAVRDQVVQAYQEILRMPI